MKCKSWSNKINNFVVRRLKSIKINGQQQQQQQQPATTTSQQQYLSTCSSTMPAMPKEKATAVSLSENNFTELKLKELATSATVVPGTSATTAAAMATTASATQMSAAANSRLQSNTTAAAAITAAQQRNICGCGAASAIGSTANANVEMLIGGSNSNKYLANGHSSPLAAAVAAQKNTIASPQRHAYAPSSTTAPTCCRLRIQNGTNNARTLESNAAAAQPAAVTPPKKSPKDFIFGKYIGEGSFSIVYLAVDVNTKREYAIKVCEKRHILREHKQEYIRREREVMHIMSNVPGFVNLSCTFQDERSLYFVMTYAKNGDLLPYINKVGSFDKDCTRHYAAELVLACEEMHRRNVVHRDLKPENILLDEDMHTLIADFGSAKIMSHEERTAANAMLNSSRRVGVQRNSYLTAINGGSNESVNDDDTGDDDTNNDEDDDSGSDEVDSTSRQPLRGNYHRRRKGSFVGTAQYVSPEVLQNGPITPAADLWALGCIIYQMISGLPPFRGSNDYVIFKEILACDLDFPQGFDKDAEDLIRQLLRVNPEERLGAQDDDCGRYASIRAHPFFAGVNFDVRQRTPPPIYPYLPGVSKDQDFRSHYHMPENLEPGLDDKQLTRLLGMELGTALGFEMNGSGENNGGSDTEVSGGLSMEIEKKTVTKNIFDLTDAEKQKRLEQQKSDKWHVFADNEVILKKGFVNKRKGLFARKRMLLLTTGPRLIYIDPVQMIKKGEIPWSPELRVEPKNFKIFFVHTPNRTYYLEDPEGYSLAWVEAIEKMRLLTYKDQAPLMTAQLNNSASTLPMKNSNSTCGTATSMAATTATTPLAVLKTASN